MLVKQEMWIQREKTEYSCLKGELHERIPLGRLWSVISVSESERFEILIKDQKLQTKMKGASNESSKRT